MSDDPELQENDDAVNDFYRVAVVESRQDRPSA